MPQVTESQLEIYKETEQEIEKLVSFVLSNFPGAHVELESFLTETIPRILTAQRRLLRGANIGG